MTIDEYQAEPTNRSKNTNSPTVNPADKNEVESNLTPTDPEYDYDYKLDNTNTKPDYDYDSDQDDTKVELGKNRWNAFGYLFDLDKNPGEQGKNMVDTTPSTQQDFNDESGKSPSTFSCF